MTMKYRLSDVLFFTPILKKMLRSQILKSRFRFDMKNLTEVWIQQIHDLFLHFSKKYKLILFLDSRIWIG